MVYIKQTRHNTSPFKAFLAKWRNNFNTKKKVYLAVKRMNLIEFICFDVTFVSTVRTLRNSCIYEILLKSTIICQYH